jgi:hypothetical protein
MLRFADVAAAIVDVQLGHEDATLVCNLLAERRIPFVFYTGRLDTTLLRAQWPEVPVVKKPAREQDIVSILASLAMPQVDR